MLALVRGTRSLGRTADPKRTMRTERIDLRSFIGETLELVVAAIPDDVIFSCRFEETPDVQVDPAELRTAVAELLASACGATGEVRLRIGTVAGRSGPHAFVEVSQPANGGRVVIPIPVHQRSEIRVAAPAVGEALATQAPTTSGAE
jgi:signal transduction histidine kinase